MPGVSIHVVDVSRGVVAAGMRIELYHEGRRIADAEWYRKQRASLPKVPFLDVVTYRFGIDDPDQHYHLPFKCTPWGYSCFRGGA